MVRRRLIPEIRGASIEPSFRFFVAAENRIRFPMISGVATAEVSLSAQNPIGQDDHLFASDKKVGNQSFVIGPKLRAGARFDNVTVRHGVGEKNQGGFASRSYALMKIRSTSGRADSPLSDGFMAWGLLAFRFLPNTYNGRGTAPSKKGDGAMEQFLSTSSKGIFAEISPHDLQAIDDDDISTCCKRRERLGRGRRRLTEDLSDHIATMGLKTDTDQVTQISPRGGTVRYILKEHRRLLGTRFVNIQTLINMIAAAHGNEIEIWQQIALIRKGFEDLQASMLKHLLFEKDFLFPWIISDNDARLNPADTTEKLERQHSKIAIMTEAMVARTGKLINRPEACEGQQALHKALMSFKVEVENHIQMEHNLLFPRILKKSVVPLTTQVGRQQKADLSKRPDETKR